MRTHSTRSSHGCLRMASTTLARAESFSSGATESSRSRNDMSAGTVGAFSRKRSFEPGVEKHDRRGRERLRWDMSECYRRVTANLHAAPTRTATRRSGPCLRSQVGGDELLAQQLVEAGRGPAHEAPAQ